MNYNRWMISTLTEIVEHCTTLTRLSTNQLNMLWQIVRMDCPSTSVEKNLQRLKISIPVCCGSYKLGHITVWATDLGLEHSSEFMHSYYNYVSAMHFPDFLGRITCPDHNFNSVWFHKRSQGKITFQSFMNISMHIVCHAPYFCCS